MRRPISWFRLATHVIQLQLLHLLRHSACPQSGTTLLLPGLNAVTAYKRIGILVTCILEKLAPGFIQFMRLS